jgi:hypothetical protein
MEKLTAEQVEVNKKIAADKVIEDTKVKEAAELKATNKTEALRELSKELGINAFEPTELKEKFNEFTKWQTDQKSEQEVLQGEVDAYKLKETEWLTKETEFNGKLKASELGIPTDKIEDALKLAGGNPDNLAEVIKKYPIFKSTEGIHIGVQQSNEFQNPTGGTEAEQYMADNPQVYGKYVKK